MATLAEAVELALDTNGTKLLQEPKRLLSFMLDYSPSFDETDTELLTRNIDEELLSPFARVASQPAPSVNDLQMATQEVARILAEGRFIADDPANMIAGQLMLGVGRHLGIIPSPRATMPATQQEPHTTPPAPATTSRPHMEMQQPPESRPVDDQPARKSASTVEPSRTQQPETPQTPSENKKKRGLSPTIALVALGVVVTAIVATVLLVAVIPQFRRSIVLKDRDGTKNVVMTIEGWKGGTVVLPEPTVEHEGYVFVGWIPQEYSSSGGTISPGDEVSVDNCGYYLATWNPTVTFDGNGADMGSMESIDVAANQPIKLPEPKFTKKGSVFTGWQDKEDESERVYAPDEEAQINKPTTFSAVWSPQVVIGEASVKGVEGASGTIEGWDSAMKCILLLVRNDSTQILDFDCETATLSDSGSKLETNTTNFNYVAPGDSVLITASLFKSPKKAKAASYTIQAEPSSSWGAPLAGSVKEEITRQEKNGVDLTLTNTSDKEMHIFTVHLIAKDDSGSVYAAQEFLSIDLKGGESSEVTFEKTSLVGPAALTPDWRNLDITFYYDGYLSSI